MARCETCITPCNCYVDEDGYWSERPQDGRRNTVASGAGTLEDPLTISFMQSEFYQPSAGELRGSKTINSGSQVDVATVDYTTEVYQTPERVMIKAPLTIPVFVTFGTWFMVGASATFSASATGERIIWLRSDDPNLLIEEKVAGNFQPGIASRPTILSCVAFLPGYLVKGNSLIAGLVDNRVVPYVVTIFQTSGSPMNISNIKLWITTI